MPRLIYDKDQLVADWKTGKYTVRDLAHKHKVSHTTAHNLTKGVDKTLAPLIDKIVETKQELATLSLQELTNVEDEVDSRIRGLQFFKNVTHRNLSMLDKKLSEETTIQEHLIAQTAYQKGRETWLGKESAPTTAVQINNNNNFDRSLPPIEAYKKMVHGDD